jgi:hypothetical protein
MSINVYTSHGSHKNGIGFVLDEFGNVLETHLNSSWTKGRPIRFDLKTYSESFGTGIEDVDILDIGYWLSDGAFEPPVPPDQQ